MMNKMGLDKCLQARRETADNPVWITPLAEDDIVQRAAVAGGALVGATFAIKDNIDLAGVPTSAACPDYAYVPAADATVVARLIAAGAVPFGKTNLDQFATGLVGVRSPHGVPVNPHGAEWIPGGSSSGSAVAVATGQCDFSLGTDTAGSGRVPAAFNELVGLKPTCGLVSTKGVVPACRTLDCVSIFTQSIASAAAILKVAAGFDPEDPYSRQACPPVEDVTKALRVGVPRAAQREFFGDAGAEALFDSALQRWQELGAKVIEIDYAPFTETAQLLYEGPWVAERFAAIKDFITTQPKSLHPVTRQIIGGAEGLTAVAAFEANYRLADLRRRADRVWQDIDLMVTPTAGTCYTVEQVEADPVQLNTNLGYYTNHMNLLDLCAVAVPAGRLPSGVPWGITLAAPAFCDDRVLRCGALFVGEVPPPTALAYTEPMVKLAVCGAHLSGLPLNSQLTQLGATLDRVTQTAPSYRLYALAGTTPPKPGMVRGAEGGASIDVEVWEMTVSSFGKFVAGIPAPLGIGTVQLSDGTSVQGFVCESVAVADAHEVTAFGGWRGYIESLEP